MVLMSFTIAAFLLAAVFAVVAWRFARDERRRAEARVSALAAAIDGTATVVETADRYQGVPVDIEGRRQAVQVDFEERRQAVPVDIEERRQAVPVDTAPAMFTQNRSSAVQGRPLLKLAIGFAFAVSVIVLIAMTGDRTGDRHEAESSPSAMAAPAATDVPGTLELISMRHDRKANAITVTGLVRNAGTATPDGLTAVVFAFDRDGNYVASGRAPLEFPRLATGDESPFRVTVPDVKDVGRYRVSFRTEAGVVRHVDRRPSLQVSAN